MSQARQVTSSWVLAALLLAALWPLRSAQALTPIYPQDQIRHPSSSRWAPRRFGYIQAQHILPGTADNNKKKKCIPNGQARCIPRPQRPNPFASNTGSADNLPKTRSGMTASPTVKTFDYEYPEEN